jgi:hypothetical protein
VSGEDYFLITVSDGEVRVIQGTEATTLATLDKDEESGEITERLFEPNSPRDRDPMYWGGRSLIIRGSIVTVKPVSVKYELG